MRRKEKAKKDNARSLAKLGPEELKALRNPCELYDIGNLGQDINEGWLDPDPGAVFLELLKTRQHDFNSIQAASMAGFDSQGGLWERPQSDRVSRMPKSRRGYCSHKAVWLRYTLSGKVFGFFMNLPGSAGVLPALGRSR